MVYELDTSSRDLNTEFTLKDCLFKAVELTKYADADKYKYSGYNIVHSIQFIINIFIT